MFRAKARLLFWQQNNKNHTGVEPVNKGMPFMLQFCKAEITQRQHTRFTSADSARAVLYSAAEWNA